MRFWGLNERKAGLADKKRIVIGVAGSCSGAGVTHTCLRIANYYANVCGYRTVIGEYGGHRDFLKICIETDKVHGDYRTFTYKGMTFVSGDEPGAREKLKDRAQVIVLDCGVLNEKSSVIFGQSDIRVVVLSAALYRMAKSVQFVDMLAASCIYVSAFGGSDQIARLSRRIGAKVLTVPYQPDPFRLSKESVCWIGSCINCNY